MDRNDEKHSIADLVDFDLEGFDLTDVPAVKLATMEKYLHDPAFQERFRDWVQDGGEDTPRTPYVNGTKGIEDAEFYANGYDYFVKHQRAWSAEFRRRLAVVLGSPARANAYIKAFREMWIDGRAKRQNSPPMMAIKASIRDHDRTLYPDCCVFVDERIPESVTSMLQPNEMHGIFELNQLMLQTCMDDYLGSREDSVFTSINRLYVHRGIFPTKQITDEVCIELNYLSSYSLAVTVTEVFSQTYPSGSKGVGFPTLLGAPLPLLMSRVVAFAPFISRMDVGQLEFVVAPPIKPYPLAYFGKHGTAFGFHEYGYDAAPRGWAGHLPDRILKPT